MIYTLTLNPALDRELTVSEIKFGQVLRANSIQIDYGGKGFNVSRALLALGVESVALAFIGGAVGEQLISGLSQIGIATDFVRLSEDTRTNISVVDKDHSHFIKVNEPGPKVSEAEAAKLLEKISSMAQRGDWWVLAGSSPPGIKPIFITKVIDLIQDKGAFVLVDMEGEYLYQGCISHAFLVKPNQAEASLLINKPVNTVSEWISALVDLHMLGAQRVVISLGKEGALYFNSSHIWRAESPIIQERNPIGAGDALLAGILLGFVNKLHESEVLRWGVACGAACASLDGTAVGSYQLVRSLVDKVRVYEIKNP